MRFIRILKIRANGLCPASLHAGSGSAVPKQEARIALHMLRESAAVIHDRIGRAGNQEAAGRFAAAAAKPTDIIHMIPRGKAAVRDLQENFRGRHHLGFNERHLRLYPVFDDAPRGSHGLIAPFAFPMQPLLLAPVTVRVLLSLGKDRKDWLPIAGEAEAQLLLADLYLERVADT